MLHITVMLKASSSRKCKYNKDLKTRTVRFLQDRKELRSSISGPSAPFRQISVTPVWICGRSVLTGPTSSMWTALVLPYHVCRSFLRQSVHFSWQCESEHAMLARMSWTRWDFPCGNKAPSNNAPDACRLNLRSNHIYTFWMQYGLSHCRAGLLLWSCKQSRLKFTS